MREIDFKYGERLLHDMEKVNAKHFDIMEREPEIKAYCDSLLQEGTVESISKLMLLVFEYEVGKEIIDYTNWGCILRLALNIVKKEEDKENSIIFKVKNIDQLVYIFRTLRFLHYRCQLVDDETNADKLEALLKELNLSNVACEEIMNASFVQKGN